MTYQRLLPFNGLAALISAAASLLAALTLLLSRLVPDIPDLVLVVFLLIDHIFIVFALMGIFGSQIEETGELGFTSFVVAEIGILLLMASFFPPTGAVVFLAGLLALAIANQRRGTLPGWGMWVWFSGVLIATVFGVLGFVALMALGLVLGAVGKISLGIALRSPGSRSA